MNNLQYLYPLMSLYMTQQRCIQNVLEQLGQEQITELRNLSRG